MALTLKRLNDLRSEQDEEEEKKEKLSGLDRLNAARGKTEEPAKKEEPAAPQQQLSGMERLNAAREKQKTEPQTAAPQVSNTYREVDKEIGRIRTRPADLSTPSWQDDPEEMAAELNMLRATLEDTGSKLTTLSKSRAMANSAVQNIGSQVKAYETKLGILADTAANSTDAEERLRAQQESKALNLYYQKAKLAQERYTARANELNSQFDTIAGQYESALQEYQAVEPKYTRRLGLGDSKAAEYEKQAEELRKQADSLYRSGQANYTLMRQAEQAEANAQKERQNYAQYLYSTEGEDKAMKYATGVEEGNRRKEEAANFGQKVLNTVAGAGANWFSNFGGSPLILMAELMGMHDEAEALRANDQFSSTAQELKRNAGKVGGMLIDTAGAAGHMMSTAAFGGMAANALANTSLMSTLTGIAESSPLVTSSAARAGAKLATGLMGEFIGNAGNAAISLSSGVNGFNEARENGASYDRALANGISKGVLEYVSNKLSAGMPFENSAEQKGLLNQAVEYLAGKLGASEVLKKFGGTIVGKAVGKAWDIFGEGLEEVVTGIGDPIIDYLTYDKTADWRPKIDKLVEDFEGGVLLSLLMTGGEAALSPSIKKSAIVDRLVSQGVDKKTAQSWATPLYQEMKAIERIQKAVEDAYQQPVLQQMANKLSAGQQLSGQDARKILADPEAKQTLIDAGLITGREINDSTGRTKVAQAAEQFIRQQAEQQNTPPVPEQGLKLPTAEEKAPVQESRLRLKGTEKNAENREGADEDAQIAEATVRALREAANAQPVQESKLRLKSAEETEIERDARTIQEYIDFANSERAAEDNTQTERKALTGMDRLNAAMQGEQTPTVQQNAPQATETPGSKTIQKALATARQKAADKAESLQNYGFTTAVAEAIARVQNEQSWDAEEKAVAQALRDAGYEPTFTMGLIENTEGDSVLYLVEGNKIAIRADSRQSIQTLAEQAIGQTLNIDQSARTQAMADINKARETAKVETPKAETPKVSARYQAAVDSAKAAGASEESGALAGRLAEALSRDIVFYNEDGPNGNLVNGYTADGKIYINAGADRRTVAWVVGHELTHNVENSKVYNALKNLARQAAKAEGQNWNDRIQQRVDSSARVAEKLQNPSVKVDSDGAERELVADFFADRLLTNEDAIRAVCEYETSAAKRIRNYIQNLLRKLGGKEPTLEWALDRYNKALKDVAKKAQAEAEKKLQLKSTQTAPKSSVESVQKYSLNVQTIDYAVNYTADNEQTKTQLELLKKDITRLADIQNQINKEMGGRSAKNIHDLNDYLQTHPKVWQELWDMQEALEDEGIRCDFVTEPGSPNVIDDSQVPGGLKGLPIEYVASDTGKRYKFTAFWRNMPQMLLDSMSHDSRERLRTAIMQGVEDAYARKTGETDLLPYFKDQFPTAKEIEKVAGARTIKNIRNQTEDRVQAPIRDAEKTVAALNLNSACPMFTIGNNGCYMDACYLTQMANGATGTNLFRSAWYTGELLQISDADIQRMNELGGLRVNGVGDTTLDNKSQLKDALRHAGMRGLKVKMITKQRASLEVLAEMYNSGTDISHVTVQPSMDNLWIPAELDDVYGAGVRGNTQLAKTVKAGRNEAAATGYEEMFGRATNVIDGVLHRKYGFTPEQIREMKQDFPFVQITPRYVVCTAQEIAEIALNRNGDYVNGGKVIQTLMHGKVPSVCVSDYPGDIINFGGARHVVERKDGKWHFYGEFIGKGGLVGKIIDGPNTPYGKVQRYVEDNYTKAEQDKIWLTLKNQMCCQANDFKDACAGCQSLCARGCAAFSSEDFDYRKYSLKDKAQAMEMDEAPPTEGLRLKAEPEAKQESGLRLEGKAQFSAEDEEYAEAQAKYQGKPMAGTEEFYTYDFLKSLPDMKIVYAPSIDDLYGKDGFTKQDVIQKGKSNAAETGEERGEYIYTKNNYTGRDIRVTSKGLRHGLQGKNFRILTNARLGAIAGDLIKNAVPINKLTPNTDDPNVKSTYAMAAYVQDEIGHEYVAILTIDQRDESLVDIDLVDVLHSVNGRYRNSSRVGTKPQGFNPSTTAKVSVADFLKVVNECFQSILSKDVYENLNKGEGERAKGYYTGRRVYSAEDDEAYNRTAIVTEDTVDKWLKDYASKGTPKYAQAYITRMTPKQFVDLTTSTAGRLLIGNQTEALDAEKLIEATRDQPLQIQISDGEVVGHEGRHRATALSRAGVDSIPVLVFDYSNKYSKTDVPEMTLQGQDFGRTRSNATETLRDLMPLSYENRNRIIQEYGTQPATERLQEKYSGRKTMQFSAEDSDDKYRQTPETPALEKLGIRLAASKGKYHLAEQLLERDKAAKALMRATKKAEKKLNATKAEKEFAAGIAAGIYEERDIPKSMNRDKVTALADYYAAEDSFKENMLAEVRDRINGELKQEAEDLLLHGDFNFKKLSMLQLNERTPDRTFRAMFGTQKGKEIFDWLIRPVQMNESEKTRWHQKQMDRVRKFEDSKGKTRALTREESELTMLVMEGKAAAAAVADMEKKGLDAEGIRNAAENIRNGSDPTDAAWEFGLKDKDLEIAKNYARWMDTQDKLKDADSKIIENAAEKYSEIFDEFYDAINDFLVAHGYEPIGYIKGYAPHMQPEETQNLLEKAFDKLGIDLGNDKAQGLPASIAGETAYFKPNKRWDPYFLHRTGTLAEYDIEKAYQRYVGYLSDILYHTDDIMRVRNFEKMLRKTYAPDEIREDLDMIQVIRDARPEDRQGMLRNQGKIGKTTQLSAQEVSEKLDEWEESLYNALKEDRNYNNLVMWLSNYANILAGKQSFADRGWEYSLGRNSLNFANRLQAAFQRSLVAGSLTSALNQTAQLPMIKTELGDRWYYQAALDILRGNTKNFWQDSDFLTGKHGVDMLTTESWDKFINVLYTPSTVVDNIVSTIAVRGAYLKAVNQGQSYSEAMKTADDFGRKIMGSREKGTRPLAYESKGLFSRMIHMFQVEAANSWDHIASDLPYEIKEIAKTQGKTKAARTLAALLIRGLLSAFLLNRITEEVYGGTPAPFDVIGLAMNFVASGKGMTTNKYLKTIIDNGLEKIGQDRYFGTEDVDTEFDVGKGLEELGYNVMNDVPLLRNLAGVLGLGDQTVALPGASGELTDMYDAAKDMIEEGADAQAIENLIRASAKFGAQFVPAGRQAMKTGEGIDAVIRGGSYNKKGNLQYPIDETSDKVKAILFGKNATNAAQEHWASGEGTMKEKATEMVAKLRGQGMTGTQAQDAAKTVKSFSGDNKWNQTVAYIDRLDITDSLKDEMYFYAGYKEGTLKNTPWHKGGSSGKGKTYAKSGLRIPTPERVEPQSKPRIRTETTTATTSKPRIRTT